MNPGGAGDRSVYGAPVWTLYHRHGKGGRWAAVATDLTFSEAVARSNAPGDWWYALCKPAPVAKPARTPKAVPAAAATPSLFS